MELEVDQSLLDSGSAREIVNRLQKMRKSSGLQASDTVAVYFEPAAGNDADATEGMLRMLQSEAAYLTESLGCAPLPISAKPADATVVASGECQLRPRRPRPARCSRATTTVPFAAPWLAKP